MFTCNGFNIYPREIESAVREMPGVESARVTEIVIPERESEIALEVTGSVSEEEVKQWCAQRLSAYKQPTTVSYRAHARMTATPAQSPPDASQSSSE